MYYFVARQGNVEHKDRAHVIWCRGENAHPGLQLETWLIRSEWRRYFEFKIATINLRKPILSWTEWHAKMLRLIWMGHHLQRWELGFYTDGINFTIYHGGSVINLLNYEDMLKYKASSGCRCNVVFHDNVSFRSNWIWKNFGDLGIARLRLDSFYVSRIM